MGPLISNPYHFILSMLFVSSLVMFLTTGFIQDSKEPGIWTNVLNRVGFLAMFGILVIYAVGAAVGRWSW